MLTAMGALPLWHSRLPHIRQALAELTIPVLDRSTIEQLFGLRRRQAIRLMASFGGHQAGRTYLIERQALLARLDALARKRPVSLEIARKHRLEDALQTLVRRARPAATAIAEIAPAPGWPDGVSLAPGQLRIAFSGPEELLGRILALTEAAATDYDSFAARLTAAASPDTGASPAL